MGEQLGIDTHALTRSRIFIGFVLSSLGKLNQIKYFLLTLKQIKYSNCFRKIQSCALQYTHNQYAKILSSVNKIFVFTNLTKINYHEILLL